MKPESAITGVTVSLAELLDMRHHLDELRLFSSAGRRSPLLGLHHSRLRGRGVDFDQVRVYQPGDDVRNIDWRVTARTGEPHTKLFHEERERPVFLIVEQSATLFFGSARCFKSVLAARVAALLGWSALAHSDRIGGLIFGGEHINEVRPRRSKHSLLQFLGRLVSANQALLPTNDDDSHLSSTVPNGLAAALRRAREVLRPGSLVLLVCDERSLDESAERQLGSLARHCDLILLPLSDPLDQQLPDAGALHFAQGDARLTLDSSDPHLRQHWQALAEARAQRWLRLERRLGVLLLPLSTQRELLEQLSEHIHAPQHSSSAASSSSSP